MAYYDPQSMYDNTEPYDLTILYMEDAREWCEYLFDLFQPYDVHQNSEDITDFPTQEATLDAIQTSRVRIIIISPTFIERCTAELERYVPGKSVVGLLCGVTRSELPSLERRVPSYKQWELIEAQSDAKDLTQITMKMLQDSMSELDDVEIQEDDGNSVYMPMVGNIGTQRIEVEDEEVYTLESPYTVEEDNLYMPGNQSERIHDIYGTGDEQAVTVLPERILLKRQETFHVSFSYEALQKDSSYLIKVTGKLGSTHTEGIAQNPYVLCVHTPEDLAAGPVSMEITSQGKTVANCDATLVMPMDEVAENLKDSLEPMNFICESLGISPANSNSLDNLLFDHIRKFQEDSMLKNALTSSQVGKQAKSDKLYPTALHFAASFGLKTVTNYLMGLPGADHALNVKNVDNDTPVEMAKKNGHGDLSDIMSYPTEPSTTVKTNQGYVKMMSAVPPGYHRPRPPDIDELHRMLADGKIYDAYYPKTMTRIGDDEEENTKGNYEPLGSDETILGPALPNPIIPALPPHATQQTEMSDFQKELWEIDQRLKNQEISQEQAQEEFENWRMKYMESPKSTVAAQRLPQERPAEKTKKGILSRGKRPVNDCPREHRTQSTISRPILSSSHSVPQSTSTPSYLRAVSVPGTGPDVTTVQPPPSRHQVQPVRQRPPRPPNDDRTTRRRSSGKHSYRISLTELDYQPPTRDPPPIPTTAQPPASRPRQPVPAPRPRPTAR